MYLVIRTAARSARGGIPSIQIQAFGPYKSADAAQAELSLRPEADREGQWAILRIEEKDPIHYRLHGG